MTFKLENIPNRNKGEKEDWLQYHPLGREKVLLRGKETCKKCGNNFLSLYPISDCIDHFELEGV